MSKFKRMALNLSEELYQEIKALSDAEGISMNEFCRKYLKLGTLIEKRNLTLHDEQKREVIII